MTDLSDVDGNLQRMLHFETCYLEVFPAFAAFVHQRGGHLEAAREVFQEALLIYYERMVRQASIEGNHKYLYGICRHLWRRKNRHSGTHFLELTSSEIADTDGPYEEPSSHKLKALLSRVGERCMELLTSFYYHNQTMQEIAHAFGFSGERSATVQKYKCLEKVREHVKTKKMTYEDFLA